MALSMSAVVEKVAALTRTLSGLEAVYSEAASDDNALPAGISTFPSAVVQTGADLGYVLNNATHQHDYEVKVKIFETGADIGQRTAAVLPFVDALISLIAANVKLGGIVVECAFHSQSGVTSLEYGGGAYTGVEVTFHVTENGPIAPAVGS